MVLCPVCGKPVDQAKINEHLDSSCTSHVEDDAAQPPPNTPAPTVSQSQQQQKTPATTLRNTGAGFASIFQRPSASKSFDGVPSRDEGAEPMSPPPHATPSRQPIEPQPPSNIQSAKRPREDDAPKSPPVTKKPKTDAMAAAQPLADRMRPRTLDDIHGQALIARDGVLRALVEADRVPSMILWGGPGTGKTTIARLIAGRGGARFVEINSASSGVAECKRLFGEARSELALTGRRTVVFCDEIHRFSRSQQDVFLAPVEAGVITLIGATTENPSFKVINALMSRCRVFTLDPLDSDAVSAILRNALRRLYPPPDDDTAANSDSRNSDDTEAHGTPPSRLDDELLAYMATASAGDARTALNLLDLALALVTTDPETTPARLKSALTTSLLHDRASDAHYNLISAFQKSIRGSSPNGALYYLARALTAGEDPLYLARRLLVIASEDIGLADPSALPLAAATWTATQALGMPEARIPLAHCTAALALAPKSVRAYRGLCAAEAAVREPGAQGMRVPAHLRNAPTRLLREIGAGVGYKYNPDFVGGRVRQGYLPEGLEGRVFLGDADLGDRVDPDLGEAEGGEADGDDGGNAMGGMADVDRTVDGVDPDPDPDEPPGPADGERAADDVAAADSAEPEERQGDADEKIELEEWEA